MQACCRAAIAADVEMLVAATASFGVQLLAGFPRHDDDGDDNHNNKTNQKEENCNNVTMSLVGRTWHNTDTQISKLWYYQAFTDSIPQAPICLGSGSNC